MVGILFFGVYGYNFEGICIGQDESCYCCVVKVWDWCEFCDFDDLVDFGICNIKVVLKWLW